MFQTIANQKNRSFGHLSFCQFLPLGVSACRFKSVKTSGINQFCHPRQRDLNTDPGEKMTEGLSIALIRNNGVHFPRLSIPLNFLVRRGGRSDLTPGRVAGSTTRARAIQTEAERRRREAGVQQSMEN